MKSNVQVTDNPVVTVTLDLSLEEFAALEVLRYRFLGGESSVRADIDNAFEGVMGQLPAPTAQRIRGMRPTANARVEGFHDYDIGEAVEAMGL